jgi:hypothetical protein
MELCISVYTEHAPRLAGRSVLLQSAAPTRVDFTVPWQKKHRSIKLDNYLRKIMTTGRSLILSLMLGSLIVWCQGASGHGGVGMEDDKCVIKIGFLTAHFTGYQPLNNGTQEFCEDIPEVADSIFVIEYLHDFLKEMQVDFRIIKDVNEIGIFANWDDILVFDDIEKVTVFYQPPVILPEGALKVRYEFEEGGGYIGIVTALHPEKEKTYHSVFYFQVGGSGYGYVPLFVALLVLAQALYFYNNRAARK